MAKQTWNNPIDKNVDWGGDATTGNLPVSGEMVQRFIKESLDGKAGLFHYDATNNRYLVFADADARDEYLLDPTQTELIIGTFDAPFNYTAEINLTSAAYNAVFLGSTGNYIDFTFDIKNKQGASTGENVTVTYTFIRNATRHVVKETRKFGDNVHFNVDKYLGEGTNTVIVGITGQTSLAATTVAITYQVVNLVLTDKYDISKSYNLSSGAKKVEVPFSVSGYGTKIVEWYLDGVRIPFVKAEDEIVDVSVDRTKYIEIANLQQGTHSLQFRAYTVVNGEQFYTDTLYRDIMVYTGANNNVIIGVAVTIPRLHGILGTNDHIAIYDMIQFVPYTLRFATYSPSNAANTEVVVSIDGKEMGRVGSVNNVENRFVITPSTAGTKTLTLSAPNVSKEFQVVIKETDMDISEIDSGLVLNFTAEGKTYNSPDRGYWTDGVHNATLSGFNWNETSGWFDGRLEMNAGSSIQFDYAPLAGNPTDTGKTIEIEWSTKNVTNDDAVICDLRGDDGVGILITATKVSMKSADGVVVETEYKSDENVRVGFVINQTSGTTNQMLSFIYANGIVSRGDKWAQADSYTSDRLMKFTATEEAEVSLKSIRIYDAALTSDNMLNNYILYRDTIAEMMEIYDRNDVYEEGTTTFSPDKMMGRLPVMIVTGDIPVLENTSDKDTQIVVDIDYYNMQDTSKSFRMTGAAMRPQGTSSMGYPKKNFRIYTQEVNGTILYDANGNVVEDKLYSFKDGAQPVNCWCLKADYAESSGTHNTGIARLWNEALMNVQIEGEYVCRTGAQKAALAAGYPYDVRTTIDGFPILLFYRPTRNDDVIFIGKYNFNNDKSTESVFGFTGIPGFNNGRMQCWEVLNNGNALALFTTVANFDGDWAKAFESRYPNTKTPYTGDLKAFCQWMVNVSQADFATEKWQHLNVYMMAAYWCYLMRHAAADQFVKNAMFTSEDGQHFYYILYDNDTINGLINTGHLRIKPTDDRQTVDESGSHVFAGYDSRLWNMLENDEEFITIVSAVDNALYSAGISYANTIKIFDEEQADKWVERVYNQDAQYKYVGPYVERGVDNLYMLQGKRDLHRRWWLAKRFSIYDAKYVSGTYKSQNIELKCIDETPAGLKFKVTSGYPLDYGYGINNVPREFGVYLNNGESYTFETKEKLFRGDPIRIYGAPHLSEIDLSLMSDKLAVVTIDNVYDESLGTRLTKLVLGNANKVNVALAEISGLKQATSLEYLDIQGMTKMTSLDLSNHAYFKTLKAKGSGISSVSFAKGAPVERLELPATMRVLSLEQLPYLKDENIIFEDITGLSSISIKSCPNVTNDFDFVYGWYTSKTVADARTSLVMDNVDWQNVDVNQFMQIAQIGRLSLKGRVYLNSITLEQMNVLMDKFGESAFNEDAEFFIDGPADAFVLGKTELLEGTSETYKVVAFGGRAKSIQFSLYNGSNSYTTVTQNGVLTVKEGFGQGTFTMRVIVTTEEDVFYKDVVISVAKRIYPTASNLTIEGASSIESDYHSYSLSYPDNVNGEFDTAWTLTANEEGYVGIDSFDDFGCTLKRLQDTHLPIYLTLTATLTKKVNGAAVATISKDIVYINEDVAETDPGIIAALYGAGLCSSDKFITKEEAARVTASDLQPGTEERTSIFSNNSKIKSFDGFQYFTQITEVPVFLFQYSRNLASIKLPSTVISIGRNAFFATESLKSIELPETLASIGDNAFNISGLESIELHEGITKVGRGILSGTKITELTVPSSFSTIPLLMCSGCSNLSKVTIKEGISEIDSSAFAECDNLQEIHVLNGTAPVLKGTPFGSSTSGYTGRNTYNAGVNTLYVPVGATGYDTGEWKNTLLNPDKCGFHAFGSLTISSNRTSAQFSVSYATEGGLTKTVTLGVGTFYLSDVKYGASMTIVPITTGVGEWDWTTKTIIYGRDNNAVENNAYFFPTNATIEGDTNPVKNNTYTWSTTIHDVDGAFTAEWSLSGEITSKVKIASQDNTKCVMKIVGVPTEFYYGTLTLTLRKTDGTLLATATKSLAAVIEDVIVTSKSNEILQKVLYVNGLVANETYSLKSEIEKINYAQLFGGSTDKPSIFYTYKESHYGQDLRSFDEFQYFTGVDRLPNNALWGLNNLSSVVLPNTITSLGRQAIYGISIKTLTIPSSVTSFARNSVSSNRNLKSIISYAKATTLTQECFEENSVLESITIPESVTSIESMAIGSCPKLREIICKPKKAPVCNQYAFGYSGTSATSTRYLHVPTGATGYEEGVWSMLGFYIYGRIHIVSNKSDARFNVSYTTSDGTIKTINVGTESTYINDIKYDTQMTITPVAISGYTWSEPSKTFVYNDSAQEHELNAYIYPTSMKIEGAGSLIGGNSAIYSVVLAPGNFDAPMTYTWSVSGSSNVSITPDGSTCVVNTNNVEAEEKFTLTCVAKSDDNNVTLEVSKEIILAEKTNYITATYSVTNTSSAINLLCEDYSLSNVIYMEVDGIEITPSLSFAFTLTGNHTVKMTLSILDEAFSEIDNLITVDFSNCKGSKYNSFYKTFYFCTELQSIEWGECSFPNMTELAAAFAYCKKLTTIDLEPFKGAPITTLASTFNSCYLITSIDLSPLENAPITNFVQTFSGCKAAKTIIMPWNEAPNASNDSFGNFTDAYTGRNTYNTGENVLYVPNGATGYDSGYWLSTLQNPEKCGFTISYTL